jgi:hypothetical protein
MLGFVISVYTPQHCFALASIGMRTLLHVPVLATAASLSLTLLLSFTPQPALAASSANFVIPLEAVNSGGVASTSANFKMGASIGDGFAFPPNTSTNFAEKGGFQPINLLSVAQTITFSAQTPATQTFSPAGTFSVNPLATASSGLTVTYSSLTTGVCNVSGSTVTIVTAGLCTIAADQAGNTSVAAAPRVTQSITINKANQAALTATSTLTTLTVGQTATLGSTGGNGTGAVSFMSNNGNCTVTGSPATTLTAAAAGGCIITATKAGDTNYNAISSAGLAITTNAAVVVIPTPPTPPTNLACVSGVAGITCGFGTSTSSGGTTITGYQLTCRDSQGNNYVQTTIGGSITLAGLPSGRSYTCQASALSNNGTSSASNSFSIALRAIPLFILNYLDFDGNGFGTVFARVIGNSAIGNTSNAATASGIETKAGAISYLGRFDGAKLTFTAITDIGDQWAILGAGDITGSNRSSLISRNTNNDVRVDFSLPPVRGTILRQAKSDWVLEAVIDLDGDGRADMLWRYIGPTNPDGTVTPNNDSGVVFAWYMNANNSDPNNPAVSVGEVRRRGGAPLSWSLIGATDINGDGRADLIWQSPTNDIRALAGTTNRDWVNLLVGRVPTGYSILKLGDVNADGRGDVIFKDAAGRVKVWLLNGVNVAQDINLPSIDATWTYFASGDFNGDGTLDIVWKKPDGTLVLWLMNAANPTQPTIIDNAGTAPTAAVAVDF